MKRRVNSLILAMCLIVCIMIPCMPVKAADLDRILDYEITVDVNQDGTLTLLYHLDWKVLDSTSEGPLEWVKVGIPNKHYVSMKKLSPSIKKIGYYSDDGSFARLDLDRAYKKDEIVTMEFELVQDYIYQMNKFVEGETVYEFTPGWFPDCKIDKMVIRWNTDKILRTDPADADSSNGYLVWTKENLTKGERFPVQVIYSNDAFAFDSSKEIVKSGESDGLFAVVFLVLFFSTMGIVFIVALASAYTSTANMDTQKKITRTKVTYYPSCPGCGATRPEGENNCSYCGASFIKSEEIIEEKDIPKEEKALRKCKTDGLYPYVSTPNTYIRVHVTHIPVVRATHTTSHSCAHSSCACACACACAGGGRAGCSTKDFYNTNLKLRQLELKRSGSKK